MENYFMLDGKKVKMSEETAKSLRETRDAKEVFQAEISVDHYTVDSAGDIVKTYSTFNKTINHKNKTASGYRNKQTAQKKLDLINDPTQQVFAKIENYVLEHSNFNPNWEDKFENKYFIYYNVFSNKWDFTYNTQSLNAGVHITREMAKDIVEKLNSNNF